MKTIRGYKAEICGILAIEVTIIGLIDLLYILLNNANRVSLLVLIMQWILIANQLMINFILEKCANGYDKKMYGGKK